MFRNTTRFKRSTDLIGIRLPADKNGLVGRECPESHCKKYFKLKPGTGLKGENLPCNCPYCGFVGPADHFHTPHQIQFARAAAMDYASNEIHRALKEMEFDHRPSRGSGISISMKVTGQPQRFHYSYREQELETGVVCEHCTLVYAIYGAFAFCPDCGHIILSLSWARILSLPKSCLP